MFALTPSDLSGNILDCASGPASFNVFGHHGQVRAWKTFDWDAMNRLHELGLIGDPKSKAKSVPLTAEGLAPLPKSSSVSGSLNSR